MAKKKSTKQTKVATETTKGKKPSRLRAKGSADKRHAKSKTGANTNKQHAHPHAKASIAKQQSKSHHNANLSKQLANPGIKNKQHVKNTSSSVKEKHHLTRSTKVTIAALCSIAGIYFAGVLFFFNFFMPHTQVNHQNVSWQYRDSAKNILDTKTAQYELRISGDDFHGTIDGQTVNLSLDPEETVNAAITQTNPWSWPYSIFIRRTLDNVFRATYDENEAYRLLATQVDAFNQTQTPPVSANITYDDGSSHFVVIDEQPGTQISLDTVWARSQEALYRLNDFIKLDQADILQPALTSTDSILQGSLARANAMIKASPTIMMDGKPYQKIDADQVAEWISIDDNGEVQLDSTAIEIWCKNNLSKAMNTVGSTRTYTRPDKKKITVKGGSYGWSVNTKDLAKDIKNALETDTSGNGATVDVTVKTRAQQPPDEGGKDWGNTYIDIDLGEQKAYYYENGALAWSSAIVSGIPDGHPTPQGVYTINNNFNKKNSKSTLRGQIDPETGEREYETEVQYWMPFIGNSVGLHDADWRSDFGGSIYLTDGSHGCINLPPAKAKELCGMIERGLVVVCHG